MNTQHIMELADMYAHAKVTDDCPPEKLPRNSLKAAVEDMEATHLRELAAYRLTVENLEREIAAQQPAPSPATASKAVLAAIRAANMQLVRTGDDEFMLVTYKNAKAQCDGGKCGIGGYCDDCPTAQADTQPSPAPATFLRGVIDLCTQKGFSPENIEAWDSNDKWIADIWRQARELLAAPADSVQEDAARLERERICAVIKAEDDHCVEQGDYMLDSDDCIKIVRGEWVRPVFSVYAARKQGESND